MSEKYVNLWLGHENFSQQSTDTQAKGVILRCFQRCSNTYLPMNKGRSLRRNRPTDSCAYSTAGHVPLSPWGTTCLSGFVTNAVDKIHGPQKAPLCSCRFVVLLHTTCAQEQLEGKAGAKGAGSTPAMPPQRMAPLIWHPCAAAVICSRKHLVRQKSERWSHLIYVRFIKGKGNCPCFLLHGSRTKRSRSEWCWTVAKLFPFFHFLAHIAVISSALKSRASADLFSPPLVIRSVSTTINLKTWDQVMASGCGSSYRLKRPLLSLVSVRTAFRLNPGTNLLSSHPLDWFGWVLP